ARRAHGARARDREACLASAVPPPAPVQEPRLVPPRPPPRPRRPIARRRRASAAGLPRAADPREPRARGPPEFPAAASPRRSRTRAARGGPAVPATVPRRPRWRGDSASRRTVSCVVLQVEDHVVDGAADDRERVAIVLDRSRDRIAELRRLRVGL